MSKILYQGTELIGVSGEASAIKYDNTDSGLTASDVQAAIDENVEKVETTNEKVTALEERLQDATNDIIVPAQGTTTFNSDGSITETLVGATSRTIFNDDGSITNSLTYDDGTVVSRTTVFNADGSITVS